MAKKIGILSIAAALAVSGCGNMPSDVSPAFWTMLAPQFSMPAPTAVSAEEVGLMLAAFAPYRGPREFVLRVEPVSPGTVDLVLQSNDPRGNHVARLVKQYDHWTYAYTLTPP